MPRDLPITSLKANSPSSRNSTHIPSRSTAMSTQQRTCFPGDEDPECRRVGKSTPRQGARVGEEPRQARHSAQSLGV